MCPHTVATGLFGLPRHTWQRKRRGSSSSFAPPSFPPAPAPAICAAVQRSLTGDSDVERERGDAEDCPSTLLLPTGAKFDQAAHRVREGGAVHRARTLQQRCGHAFLRSDSEFRGRADAVPLLHGACEMLGDLFEGIQCRNARKSGGGPAVRVELVMLQKSGHPTPYTRGPRRWT